ncbi:MAG TPA: LPXTG cell wall anchor domain-containing protein, partial [Candidatus Gemmiger stercoravium]|nr:LPXTG cell wall anchor domain-containing protein [Candidatus Gemmiger stercoravium]
APDVVTVHSPTATPRPSPTASPSPAPASRPVIPATGDPFPWLGVLGSILLGALGLGLLQWFRQRRL